MFYQDALNAMFIFGGIYAAQVLDWGFQELLILGIIVNIFAAPGAILGGWFNDKIGAKRVVMISVVGLMVTAVMAVSILEIHYFLLFQSMPILIQSMNTHLVFTSLLERLFMS